MTVVPLKGFALGAACMLVLFIFMGFEQVRNDYKKPSDIAIEFNNLFSGAQPKQFKIYTTKIPVLADLEIGERVLVSTNSLTMYEYTRNRNTLFRIAYSSQ